MRCLGFAKSYFLGKKRIFAKPSLSLFFKTACLAKRKRGLGKMNFCQTAVLPDRSEFFLGEGGGQKNQDTKKIKTKTILVPPLSHPPDAGSNQFVLPHEYIHDFGELWNNPLYRFCP